ncbi:MAG: hypothetical protein ACI8RD_002333 [Bacillariaceae sp.]|jgi:hypothetical protein
MPQVPNQPGTQDWGSVNVGSGAAGSGYKKTGTATKEKRHGAGGNSSAHSGGIMSARKVRWEHIIKMHIKSILYSVRLQFFYTL